MYNYYSKEEIEILKEGGKVLAQIFEELEDFVEVGVAVKDIDIFVNKKIKEKGAVAATVGYTPQGAPYPFPSAVCVSINDQIAHGISTDNPYVLKSGDVVSCDIVIQYKGFFVDACRTYGVGKLSRQDMELIAVARITTDEAIKQAVVGNTTDDIGAVAEKTAKEYGFQTVKELGGHGVGRKIHDRPFVPSFKNSGFDDQIKEGMVLAIEPIINVGSWKMQEGGDGYLYKTVDGKKSAQFEETVLITKNGPEILTKL
ncbi:type I methionyl aminopeptidase [Candidatus Campbellbacteria bacterium]|nr:MAG: type I methionyl aminopeptidase [Candidatus Campbellbacteria bacterium]